MANWFCVADTMRHFPRVRSRALIYAIDELTVRWAKKNNVPWVSISQYDIIAPGPGAPWGVLTSWFKYALWPLVADLIELGYTVIFSDTDAVWLRDPRPMLAHDSFFPLIRKCHGSFQKEHTPP